MIYNFLTTCIIFDLVQHYISYFCSFLTKDRRQRRTVHTVKRLLYNLKTTFAQLRTTMNDLPFVFNAYLLNNHIVSTGVFEIYQSIISP